MYKHSHDLNAFTILNRRTLNANNGEPKSLFRVTVLNCCWNAYLLGPK